MIEKLKTPEITKTREAEIEDILANLKVALGLSTTPTSDDSEFNLAIGTFVSR